MVNHLSLTPAMYVYTYVSPDSQHQLCETKGCPTMHALYAQLIRPTMREFQP